MAKKHQIYKCDICGNIVELLHGGDGDLVCCGEEMKLFGNITNLLMSLCIELYWIEFDWL